MLFKKERKQIDIAIYYKEVFESEGGKKVLGDLQKHCHFMSNTFSPDPYEHAFNAGRRDTILYILHKLNIDIDEAERRLKKAEEEADKNYYE